MMGFVKNKKWYESKAVLGSGFAFLLAVVTAVSGEVSVYSQLLIAVGTALGVYGRFEADSKVRL